MTAPQARIPDTTPKILAYYTETANEAERLTATADGKPRRATPGR